MKNLGTEFKVGVFTLFASLCIGYMFVFLAPEFLDSKDYNTFYTVVNNASGIVQKTHVRTNGVTVGKVADILLEASKTRIVLNVDAAVKIPVGSMVEIRTRGLLGETFIEIVRSPDTGNYIESNQEIPINDGQIGMQELIGLVGQIAKDVKKVTSTFANVLGDEAGETSVANIVGNIEKFTKEIRELVQDNRSDIRSLIANLESTSATLKNVIGNNESSLNDIVANVRSTSNDLKHFASNIRELVSGENRQRLDRIIAQFDTTMGDVEETAKNIKLVSGKIERGEGSLGRLINDDQALTELEGAIKEIREVIAPARRLQVGVDYHNELRRDETAQHYFNLVFQTRPDKYFLIGFTDLKEREVITRTPAEDVQVAEDGSQVETRYIEENRALRFNVQFAKRWYDITARFGLFESSGGIAADYHLFSDRVRITLEAYEWDGKSAIRQTARVRSYANILFFNHIYAIIGAEDLTRFQKGTRQRDPKTNWFAGAGLAFNDQDLKALFGTAAIALK